MAVTVCHRFPVLPRMVSPVRLGHGDRGSPERLTRRVFRGQARSGYGRLGELAPRRDRQACQAPHTLRHTFITAALGAGVPLRDVQEAASHADPRTAMRYDRARTSLDRHATYIAAAFIAGAAHLRPGRPRPARRTRSGQ